MRFGINTWVWTSPLTTEELELMAPKVAGIGFDWIEIPLESLDDLDHSRGRTIIDAHGLGVSTCAAMGPDRDLVHPDAAIRQNGMAYIRGCIEATAKLGATNLVGPIYSAVGRTWQATPDERARDIDLLVNAENLSTDAERALVSIRPEKIRIVRTRPEGMNNCFPATVAEEIFRGAVDQMLLRTSTGLELTAVVANESATEEQFHQGDQVYCCLHPDDVVIVQEE